MQLSMITLLSEMTAFFIVAVRLVQMVLVMPKMKRDTINRIPQIGGVVIGNKVEIGANTTVDCGTFQPTILRMVQELII